MQAVEEIRRLFGSLFIGIALMRRNPLVAIASPAVEPDLRRWRGLSLSAPEGFPDGVEDVLSDGKKPFVHIKLAFLRFSPGAVSALRLSPTSWAFGNVIPQEMPVPNRNLAWVHRPGLTDRRPFRPNLAILRWMPVGASSRAAWRRAFSLGFVGIPITR